eukprot:362672-Chlamydomonas_euryale.AAC.1
MPYNEHTYTLGRYARAVFEFVLLFHVGTTRCSSTELHWPSHLPPPSVPHQIHRRPRQTSVLGGNRGWQGAAWLCRCQRAGCHARCHGAAGVAPGEAGAGVRARCVPGQTWSRHQHHAHLSMRCTPLYAVSHVLMVERTFGMCECTFVWLFHTS